MPENAESNDFGFRMISSSIFGAFVDEFGSADVRVVRHQGGLAFPRPYASPPFYVAHALARRERARADKPLAAHR